MGRSNFFKAVPTERQFAEALIATLRVAGVTEAIHYDKERSALVSDGIGRRTFPLNTHYATYCKVSEQDRKDLLSHCARGFLQGNQRIAIDSEQARANLLPLVRGGETRARLDRIYGKDSRNLIPAQPLVGDLSLYLVYDYENSIRWCDRDFLSQLDLNYAEALNLAYTNLILRTQIYAFATIGPAAYMALDRDEYIATQMLVTRVLREMVNGEPVVMVPHPFCLLLTASDNRQGLQKIEEVGAKIMQDFGAPLSNRLYRLVDDQWGEFDLVTRNAALV